MRSLFVEGIEVTVIRGPCRIGRLRHEWCEFVKDPQVVINGLNRKPPAADMFTFVPEIYSESPAYPFHSEPASASVLPASSYEEWWKDLGRLLIRQS
jgi:hypothetical protein